MKGKAGREAVAALVKAMSDLKEAHEAKADAVSVSRALRRIEERNHLVQAIELQLKGKT